MWDLPAELDGYRVIGFNGSGDPIALAPDDSVVFLNHDAYFEAHYINRDVSVLAEALLLYPGYQPPESERARFVEFLRQSDPRALDEGSFWSYEVAEWTDSA